MLSMILATSKNGVIGNNGTLPWKKIIADMAWFREKTVSNVIIMGRKTWQSINCTPLKNRINVVVSKQNIENADHTISVENNFQLLESLESLQKLYPNKELFIIGGAQLYESTKNIVEKIYLTELEKYFEGDTVFNSAFVGHMRVIFCTSVYDQANDTNMSFTIYQRKIEEV